MAGKRKADISTLEITGHLYFAPTRRRNEAGSPTHGLRRASRVGPRSMLCCLCVTRPGSVSGRPRTPLPTGSGTFPSRGVIAQPPGALIPSRSTV
jgi:hypothetical protein